MIVGILTATVFILVGFGLGILAEKLERGRRDGELQHYRKEFSKRESSSTLFDRTHLRDEGDEREQHHDGACS